MPTGEKILRSFPPQAGHSVSGSSVNFWTASRRSSHAAHAYWYVGTGSLLAGTAGTRGTGLLNGSSKRQARYSRSRAGGEPYPLVVDGRGQVIDQFGVVKQRDRGDLRADPGQRAVIAS